MKLAPTTFEHAFELVHRVEAFVGEIQALVDGKSEKVPKLDLDLPQSGLSVGESNAVLKTVPGDGAKRPQVVYRQVMRIPPS